MKSIRCLFSAQVQRMRTCVWPPLPPRPGAQQKRPPPLQLLPNKCSRAAASARHVPRLPPKSLHRAAAPHHSHHSSSTPPPRTRHLLLLQPRQIRPYSTLTLIPGRSLRDPSLCFSRPYIILTFLSCLRRTAHHASRHQLTSTFSITI